MACETDVTYEIVIGPQKRVRLQIYDDGIGEYVYDKPVSTISGCGHMNAIGANMTRGVYFVPSPISISKNGLATVQFVNIETADADVRVHMCLLVAVPKRDRWEEITR